MTRKDTPKWMEVGPDSVTLKLARPTSLNGVRQDKITLRVPTVGDLRAAAKQAKDDKAEQEIILFASLAECSAADIERLSIGDYSRLQEGYFRLVDEDDADGAEAASQAACG